MTNHTVDNGPGGGGYLRAAQDRGVSSATRWTGKSASPGNTEARYSRTGSTKRRQVSTMDRMFATRGPASLLPMWIQFLRPSATGRIEFSATLLESSTSGYSKNRVSRPHNVRV